MVSAYTFCSSDAFHEIKERLTVLESSVNQLLALATRPSANCDSCKSKKRSSSEAFGKNGPRQSSPPNLRHSTNNSRPHLASSFSAREAQTLLQQELSCIPHLAKNMRATFYSSLSSLKEILNTPIIDNDPRKNVISDRPLENYRTPSIELVQWMLRCKSYIQYRGHSVNSIS